jgi:hypothetical protein
VHTSSGLNYNAIYPVQQSPRVIRPPVWYIYVSDANEGIKAETGSFGDLHKGSGLEVVLLIRFLEITVATLGRIDFVSILNYSTVRWAVRE